MGKKILFSAKTQHDVLKDIILELKNFKDFEFIFHDPTTDFLDLEDLPKYFKDVDFFIVKVGSECSIDLLHFAKLYNIPTLHDLDTVLMCKNKVSLDQALRRVFKKYSNKLNNFLMPKSWTHSLLNIDKFKAWASNRLPLVIKSHYQHDKYMRFNFLVRELDKDVDYFCERYKHFLYYDVYIQEFIKCDGIDRKIYVVGDKVFAIQRENPIYIFLKEKPENIDTTTLEREEFEITDEIKNFAHLLGKELNLKIFGFDLIKPIDKDMYYLIDLNDFPGFRGIPNIENVFVSYFKKLLEI